MLLLNNKEVPVIKFPSGEVHIRLDPEELDASSLEVTLHFRSNDDMIAIMLLDEIIGYHGRYYDLYIPYFPSARQDRRDLPTESNSLSIYAKIINQLDAAVFLTILDPHSEATVKELKSPCVVSLANSGILEEFLTRNPSLDNLVLVCPDKGAIDRTKEVASKLTALGISVSFLVADKVRDYETGNIIATNLANPDDITVARYTHFLIVDDICDGGRTFIELLKALTQTYSDTIIVDLMVSHGIYSKGPEVLYEAGFNELYCVNNMHQPKD